MGLVEQLPDDDGIYISGETLRRVLANIVIWTEKSPENDEDWIAKVRATRAIREDFEAILADAASRAESGAARHSSHP